jgi:hypothetical protein
MNAGKLLPAAVGQSGKFAFLAVMIAKRFYFYGFFYRAHQGLDGIVHRS